MIETLLTALSAGGNAAMIAVALGFWRLDRRVLRLELLFNLRREA